MSDYLNRERLTTLIQKGATYCHFKKDQIILYDSHLPIGLFIIISGNIFIYSASRKSKKIKIKQICCDEKMLILPSIQLLEQRSLIQAKALERCEALFIPKFVFFKENSFHEVLNEAHFCETVDAELQMINGKAHAQKNKCR